VSDQPSPDRLDALASSATPAEPVLAMRHIRKVFPGVVALKDVDFEVLPGEVHALLGENGAGKSTLIKIVAGVYPRDGGTMEVGGEAVDFSGPADAIARGIKVVYQELDLVPTLSVAENVSLGAYPRTKRGFIDFPALRERARTLLRELGLEIDPDTLVGELRVAEQQLVEIARALSRQARLIVMDEPTSALSPAEIDNLFAVIERLNRRGVAIVYVSHKLDEIYRIADRVTVFRDGQRVITADVKKTTRRDLVRRMVGRDLDDLYPKTPGTVGVALLEVSDVTGSGLRDLNFTVSAGEVVGVFGLMGAGINTIGRVLFGASERDTGLVAVSGQAVRPNTPRDAMRKGLGLLTENRKDDGLVLPLSVRNNMTLASLGRFADWTWIHGREESLAAADYVDRLSIRTPSLRQRIRYLSGGNQQKVLMARWLLRQRHLRVLMLSEPTRGIDVGSKAEIYRLIDDMAHGGMGILFMSTEIPEILGIADRILVMREGQITASFNRDEATQDRLIEAAANEPAGVEPGATVPVDDMPRETSWMR